MSKNQGGKGSGFRDAFKELWQLLREWPKGRGEQEAVLAPESDGSKDASSAEQSAAPLPDNVIQLDIYREAKRLYEEAQRHSEEVVELSRPSDPRLTPKERRRLRLGIASTVITTVWTMGYVSGAWTALSLLVADAPPAEVTANVSGLAASASSGPSEHAGKSANDSATSVTITAPMEVSHDFVDGSRALIYAGSRLEVDYSAKRRALKLHEGGATFEVAKDWYRPFSVSAKGLRVTAVGTKFSVERLGTIVRVTVLEGVVELSEEQPNANFMIIRLKAGRSYDWPSRP
jgi:hypothetical protein